MKDQDTVIPVEYVEFCKRVAAMAAEAGLARVSLKVTPGFDGPEWGYDINMYWANGRHGADQRKLSISSEVIVQATVDWPAPGASHSVDGKGVA